MEPFFLRYKFTRTLAEPSGFSTRRATVRLLSGFSLIELLVVLAIITVVMGIVLTSHGTFDKTFILENTAYDIALSLRSAETYGISSRATIGAVTNAGYGLHFSSGNPGSFIFFADTDPAPICDMPNCKPGNAVYTNGADVLVQTYTLGNSIIINDFCVSANGGSLCASRGEISSLDIVFMRPNPDAFIRAANGGSATAYASACLSVTSNRGGSSRFVSVASSGEITARAASCP